MLFKIEKSEVYGVALASVYLRMCIQYMCIHHILHFVETFYHNSQSQDDRTSIRKSGCVSDGWVC